MNPLLQALLQLLAGGTGATGQNPVMGGAQGIAQLLPQILNLLSSLGAGSYGQKQIGQMDDIFGSQKNAANIAMNPAALAQRTLAGTLPLNKELAYSVTQAADSATAGRGMGQAPGAVAAGEAAALAPYAQQNLQMGAANAQFGFPYAFARQPEDYTSLLSQLNQYGQNSTYSLPSGVVP